MGRDSKKKKNNFEAGDDKDHKDIEAGNKTQQQGLLQGTKNNIKLKSAQQMSTQNNSAEHHNHAVSKDDPNCEEMSRCCFIKKKWILLLSMIITLLVTAVLVAMLSVTLLENEDQCFNSLKFQPPNYKLFATKTTYSTAYNYLQDLKQLPDIFSKSDSLKSINERQRLLGCEVRQLHYFGRHAARFPNSNGIKEMNNILTKIQARIDLSKFPLNSSSNNNNDNNGSKIENTTSVCDNPLTQYKLWTSFMVPEQDNLVMQTGYEETSEIAKRFKSIYPEMFDNNQTKIEFGTTDKIRTAQTALMFLKQVENYALDFCSVDQFPTDDPIDQSHAKKIQEDTCFNTFMNRFKKDKLDLHKNCAKMKKAELPLFKLNLKKPNLTQSISDEVSKKLKLSNDDRLTADETQAIYKVCRFESASKGSSIWCNLFSEDDLKFYEYLNDIEDFHGEAFGHPDQARSACPVTVDLMNAFDAAIQSRKDSRKSQPEAHFYFTHSEVIAKIIAASVGLETDPDYFPGTIPDYLQAGTAPSSRQWRSSLFTPFSANLAFALYECPPTAIPTTSGDSKPIKFDVSDSRFKVLASLNEQPIKLDGCSDYICDVLTLQHDGKIFKEKRCKLEDICRTAHMVE